jgi:hypothetical protein
MCDSSKICRENPNFIIIGLEYRVIYMKTNKNFDYFKNYITKTTNAHDYNILSHINYQHVSITSDTFIRVALHEIYEDYKLLKSISWTTERYDRCIRLSIYWLPTDFCRVLFMWIAILSPFHTVWFRDLVILALRGALLQARLTLLATSLTILYSG